jgi:hypothetical protein
MKNSSLNSDEQQMENTRLLLNIYALANSKRNCQNSTKCFINSFGIPSIVKISRIILD